MNSNTSRVYIFHIYSFPKCYYGEQQNFCSYFQLKEQFLVKNSSWTLLQILHVFKHIFFFFFNFLMFPLIANILLLSWTWMSHEWY